MPRRSGSPTSFWNAAAVLANGNSSVIEVPRGVEQIAVFMTVSAATTVSVQIAHHGVLNPDGTEPDHGVLPSSWFQLYYLDTPIQIQFTTAGSAAIIVPDFEPNWVRLNSTGAATITAGHEVTGE